MGLKLRRLHTGLVNKTVGIKSCSKSDFYTNYLVYMGGDEVEPRLAI